MIETPQIVDAGSRLLLSTGPEAVAARCAAITQRNWSRVGMAERVPGGERLFVKQFVDRRGEWHPEHYRFEAEGCALAGQVIGEIVHVPGIAMHDAERLVLCFEHVDVEPVDEILRRDPAQFARVIDGVLERMTDVLTRLAAPGALPATLPRKERAYGGAPTALGFKGLDIRNVGPGPAGTVVVFDFGRPYLTPIEECAAKLFVSVGLLNWGRPTKRFMRGPDAALLARAAELWRDALDLEAVRAEIALQRRFRTSEFQGGSLEALLKRAGVNALGRRYLGRLERLCRDLLA